MDRSGCSDNTWVVSAVPAFDDNYVWLIHDGVHAVAVDPGDAAPVIAALEAGKLSLIAILLTHHHPDHIEGVSELLQTANKAERKIPVYGPGNENIASVTDPLEEGSMVALDAMGLKLSVLAVPGHTRGHLAYLARQQGWLFCGDTLFAGGCGRVFEGSHAQMLASLDRLAALPDDTLMFCAHEYTLANLRFAQQAEPENAALHARIGADQAKRAQGLPTLPSSIGLEKASNPFLRCREAAIIDRLSALGRIGTLDPGPVAVFTALREWKNNFR